MTAESLGEVLRLLGHSSDWAANGEAALTRLGAAAYDAAVIDYYLPALDGLATVRRMRAAGLATPAVLVTAAAGWQVGEIRQEAGPLGAAVVRKPFGADELLAAIRGLLAGGA